MSKSTLPATVITAGDAPTFTTPNATMTGLAAPSRGAAELSTWRVSMAAGTRGPVHTIDREQVWMPVHGTLAATVAGVEITVEVGDALVLPAHTVRQLGTDNGAEVVVAMPAGGQAHTADGAETHPLPWAT